MLQITALMDNRLTGRKDLLCEHGLSMFVSCQGKGVLFDCGSSEKMLYNAKKLGIYCPKRPRAEQRWKIFRQNIEIRV